jgi:hypothetical protein
VFSVEAHKKQAAAGDSAGQQGQGHSLDTDAGLQDLLFHVAAEDNPHAYVDSFDQLAAWADSSLDLYRVRPRVAALFVCYKVKVNVAWFENDSCQAAADQQHQQQ